MANKENSLSHTKWLCKYHIVFTPKYRRKINYNQYKESMRDFLRQLCIKENLEIVRRLRGIANKTCVDWIINKLQLILGLLNSLLVNMFPPTSNEKNTVDIFPHTSGCMIE